jgi:hypothetical protein
MTNDKRCPVCGSPLGDDDRFCPNCGAQIGPAYLSSSELARIGPPSGVGLWPSSDPLLELEIDYPERLSRWKIFVKWLFAIPHFIVLSFFNMLVAIIVWIAWFVILFTKRYPESLYKLVLTYMRWTANVNAYVMLQRDEYPPFGEGPYPVRLDLPYPAELSRWMIFIKWLLIIPSIIVYAFVGLALLIGLFIAWCSISLPGLTAGAIASTPTPG